MVNQRHAFHGRISIKKSNRGRRDRHHAVEPARELPVTVAGLHRFGEAFFEGVVLFAVLAAVWRLTDGRRRPGLLTGVFCFGYGVARIVGELFREPDAHLGYLLGSNWLTMGMLLSLPLLAFGGWLIGRAYRRAPVS